MYAARSNESSRIWFRSDRVFLSNGQWFFHTREGVDVGPYDSQSEAEIEACMLRELLRQGGSDAQAGYVIRQFLVDACAMGRPLTPSFAQTA